MKLILPVILAVVGHTIAQDCGGELTTSFDCMVTGLREVIGNMPSMKIDHEKFEKDLMACFPDSGCKDLSEYDDEDEEHEVPYELTQLTNRLQSVTGVLGISPERLQKIIVVGAECAKGMKSEVTPKIETCVQETNPALANFALPKTPTGDPEVDGPPMMGGLLELIAKKLHWMMKEYMMGMKGLKKLAWAAKHPEVCPTEEARTKVKTCVLAAEKANMPEEMTCKSPMTSIFEFLQVRDDLCAKKDECMAAMTAPCIELKEQVPKVLCTCAGSYLEDNWEELVGSMTGCINGKLDEPVTLPAAMVNGPFKNMAKNMLKKECSKMRSEDKPDPCSPDFNPFEIMGKGKGKGKGKGGMKGSMKGKGMPPMKPEGLPPLAEILPVAELLPEGPLPLPALPTL